MRVTQGRDPHQMVAEGASDPNTDLSTPESGPVSHPADSHWNSGRKRSSHIPQTGRALIQI